MNSFREYGQVFNVIDESIGYDYVTFSTAAQCPQDQIATNTEPDKQEEDCEWYDEEHKFVSAYKQSKMYYSVELLFKTCMKTSICFYPIFQI